MKAFMTNGTLDFLEGILLKHKSIHFHYMHNGSGTLVYYEDNGKNVFGAGRTYEVILSNGHIQPSGYVVMHNIPLTEEGKPIFIDRFRQRVNQISSFPGFQSFRLLQSVKDQMHIVFTQWTSKDHFESWKESEDFMKSHYHQDIKQPAYFAARPFSVSYLMIAEEDLS